MKTLFGIIESKAEARERAKNLSDLYAALRNAPQVLGIREGQTMLLKAFIERSKRRSFDANWWDGLQREVGEPEELLTARDIAAMRRDSSYWKVNRTYHYLNCPQGKRYRCKLHPKEIALLQRYIDECENEAVAIRLSIPEIRKEVEEIRAVGPFPKELADRYNLRIDGRPLKEIPCDDPLDLE